MTRYRSRLFGISLLCSLSILALIFNAGCKSTSTGSTSIGPGGIGSITGWTQVTSGTTLNINGVSYAGGGYFYAVGDGNGIVLRSTDGRLTWIALYPSSAGPMRDVVFTDKLHGMAATGYGVSITTDGGNSWTNRDLNGNEYRSVAVIGNLAYAAGDAYNSQGIVSMTSDGGQSWQDVISPQRNSRNRENAVAMASPNYICAAGWYGDLGVSDFSYIDWPAAPIFVTQVNLWSVAMPNFKDIFAAGDSGVIVHSQDSGSHWTKLTTGVPTTLRHVAFYDSKTGLDVGDSGVIFLTKDGGTTWQNMSIPGNTFFSCAFEDATHAVIVGANGAIYRSKF